MKRLGYTRYVAQGGDWGAIITDVMATQGHPELIGMHTNLPGVIPPEINKAAAAGSPAPSGLSAEEKRAYETIVVSYKTIANTGFHGVAPANAVRHRGFTRRRGGLDARPRPGQFAAHRACF